MLLAVLIFAAFTACKNSPENENRLPGRKEIENPGLRKKDSSILNEPDRHHRPGAKHPGNTKEKSTDDLDTLRAIKA